MAIHFSEISRMTLFRGFDETFIKLLDLFFIEKHYNTGDFLVRHGEMQNNFFIIVAGEVDVRCESGDSPVSLGSLCAGQFFGEINLFDPGLATASVSALTPVRTLEISNDKFRHFISHRPELAADFVYQLAETIVKRFRNTSSTLLDQINDPANIQRAQQVDRGMPA